MSSRPLLAEQVGFGLAASLPPLADAAPQRCMVSGPAQIFQFPGAVLAALGRMPLSPQ
jgi:hypothetical protein